MQSALGCPRVAPRKKTFMSVFLATMAMCSAVPSYAARTASDADPSGSSVTLIPVNSEFISEELPAENFPLLAAAAQVSQGDDAATSVLAAANPAEALPIAFAADSQLQLKNKIELVTRQILLKDIELERFNLNYLRNAAKQGRWKGLRYAFFQEANAGCGITGGIIGTVERGRNIHSSSKVRPCIQQQANSIPMIGSIIGATAAGLEFSINQFHEFQAARHGFSPSMAKKHVAQLKREIDQLMVERSTLVEQEAQEPSMAACAEADRLEGKVLKDLRDLSLIEYERFHVGARKLLAFQQTQYLFDIAKNTTNAIGAHFAFMALHRGDRRWNLDAGLFYQIAGGLTIAGPILSRAYANVVGRYHKHGLREHLSDVETKETSLLEAHRSALERACVGRDEAAQTLSRVAAYADQTKAFQSRYDKAEKDRAKARLTATQNVGAGLIVGGCKVASGTLFVIPGGHQRYNGKTQTAGRVTNHLLFSSGVVGLSASSFSFFDTLRIQVQGELDRHKLAKQNRLPAQQIAARLKQLDELESKLKADGRSQ